MTKRAIRRIRKKKMTWLTFTCDSTNVKAVSHGTFTAERAVCVNALAINTRTIEAFINIYNQKCQHRLKLNGTTITEILKKCRFIISLFTFWMFIWSTLISLVRAEIAIPLWNRQMSKVIKGFDHELTWIWAVSRIDAFCAAVSVLCVEYTPCPSMGQISQGSPQPWPGMPMQQHTSLVVFWGFGAWQRPFSNLV